MAVANYTEEQLMTALRAADAAGNTADAQRIAQMVDQKRKESSGSALGAVSDFFTGADRETRATRELPELATSSGFLSTADASTVAKVAPAILTATDPQEVANILKANFPEVGIQYDEKGNIIAGNNKTGQRVVLNKPGASAMDLYNVLGIGSLAIPAGASGAASLPIRAAQIAAQSGATTAAQEGYQSALGGDFDLTNVLVDTAAAGALEAIPAILQAAKSRSARTAATAEQSAVDAEAARVADNLSPEMQQARQSELAQEVATQSRARRPDLERVASDVAPIPEVTQAAERLGVADALTPGQTSGSQAYRELEGALSAVPASKMSVMQKNGIDAVAQKADDFIEEFGGTLDKSALSESVRDGIFKTINDLDDEASAVYKSIAETVPMETKVDASSLKNSLESRAAELGGEEYLDPVQRRLLKISQGEPSYALIDNERKKVGAALRKSQGPYKDADTGALKMLYGLLTEAQEGAAKATGVDDMWNVAKKLTAQRKSLEDQSITLLGKNKTAAIMPKVGQAMKRLSAGDFKAFDETMAAIPKERRQEVVISALNDVFTGSSRKEKQLNPAAFVDWYESLSRNSAVKKRIMSNLPDGAPERLRDLFLVARGVRNASSERVRTGVIQGLLKDFDSESGMISKLYQVGRNAAAAEGVSTSIGVPGVGTASAIASALSKAKSEPITNAADSLISSAEFKSLVKLYAGKSVGAKNAQKAVERALMKSEKYQRWFELLPSEDKRTIIRSGLISYLSGEESD
ncbi:hypothetical protein M3924_004318 [Vibrio fluvialis]|nr:hypothetical protein [Vibrio fluvialis]